MEIAVKSGDVLPEPSELGMLATFAGAPLPAEVAGLFEPGDFSGKAKQTPLLYPRGAVAPRRLLLVGLGKRESFNTESVRQAAGGAVRQARELQVAALTLGINGELPLDPTIPSGDRVAELDGCGRSHGEWRLE